MSYSTILAVYPRTQKPPKDLAELRNGWGLAPVIWDDLAKRYVGDENFWLHASTGPYWARLNAAPLTDAERAVLHTTYDLFYVLNRDRAKLADHIDEWLQSPARTPYSGVNHWPAVAALLRDRKRYPAPAIAIQHTSASECLWDGEWDDPESDDPKRLPFDWSKTTNIYAKVAR